MDLIFQDDFLAWARAHDIAPDDRYAPPECLVYVPDRGHDRFWQVPEPARAVPFFAAHLLEGLAARSHYYLWPRGGAWPQHATDDRIGDRVQGLILRTAGVPDGFRGAIRYALTEADQLVAALFAQLTFGAFVTDDVFVIPEHAEQFLQTDHHDVVHASFTDATRLDAFVRHMASEDYVLPVDVPDWTFKKPGWMQ